MEQETLHRIVQGKQGHIVTLDLESHLRSELISLVQEGLSGFTWHRQYS